MADRSLLRILFAAHLLLIGAAARGQDRFEIDLNVRTVVKRDFANIGSAELTATPERDAGFRIRGSGVVRHPTEGSIDYRVNLDMQFRLRGDAVQYVRVTNQTSRGSEELRATIEKVLPFVYLVKALPAPGGTGSRTITTPHGRYTMVYSAGGEVALRQGGAEVCRFFLTRRDGRTRLAKFRIGRTGFLLTFVSV